MARRSPLDARVFDFERSDRSRRRNECSYAWVGLRNTIRNSNFASWKRSREDRKGGPESLLPDSRYALSRLPSASTAMGEGEMCPSHANCTISIFSPPFLRLLAGFSPLLESVATTFLSFLSSLAFSSFFISLCNSNRTKIIKKLKKRGKKKRKTNARPNNLTGPWAGQRVKFSLWVVFGRLTSRIGILSRKSGTEIPSPPIPRESHRTCCSWAVVIVAREQSAISDSLRDTGNFPGYPTHGGDSPFNRRFFETTGVEKPRKCSVLVAYLLAWQ